MFKAKHYDRIYKDKNYSDEVAQIKKYLKKGIILDIGGGTGIRSKILQDLGYECFIIDPNKEAIDIAKKKGIYGGKTIIEKSELKEVIPKGSFDNAIMLFNVLGFLVNPYLAFENINYFLRKGGRLIIDCWLPHVKKKGWSFKWDKSYSRLTYKRWINDTCIIHFWFPFKWFHEKHEVKVYDLLEIKTAMLENNGFEIIDYWENDYEATIIAEKK